MAKAKAASANDNPDNHIQILKEATCPTSSGKSTLGYQIGINDKGAIHLKVSSNDGGGFFSNEWIAFNDIQAALAEWPEDQGVTSMAFLKIFRGKSSNTPGFLLPYWWPKVSWSPWLTRSEFTRRVIRLPFSPVWRNWKRTQVSRVAGSRPQRRNPRPGRKRRRRQKQKRLPSVLPKLPARPSE